MRELKLVSTINYRALVDAMTLVRLDRLMVRNAAPAFHGAAFISSRCCCCGRLADAFGLIRIRPRFDWTLDVYA
jgi:hypothetical protein